MPAGGARSRREARRLRGGGPGPDGAVPRLGRVGRTLIERRLRDVSDRLKAVQREVAVANEQLAHLAEEADEARLRALVSETPLAEQEHHEAERHADAMRRHHDDLLAEVRQLELTQDELLDRLLATT